MSFNMKVIKVTKAPRPHSGAGGTYCSLRSI